MTTTYNENGVPSFPTQDIMLLLQTMISQNADEVSNMLSKAKRQYVQSHHRRAITQLHSSSKYKDKKWKTSIVKDGKRVAVWSKQTGDAGEDEIYEILYSFYKSQEESHKTYQEIFNMLMNKKEHQLGRSHNTVTDDTRYFNYLPEKLRSKPVSEVTTDDLRKWLVKDYLPTKPKPSALKKMLQTLRQTFEHAIDLGYIGTNPAIRIKAEDYAHFCDTTAKSSEERAFSDEELSRLSEDAMQDLNNPRAVMLLLAKETGMRAGEIAALRASDISSKYIHVHRQQLRSNQRGSQEFYDVAYTKDERLHPHDGRNVPITPECRKVLEYARALPGYSEYLIHDKQGRPVSKDSYEQNLRRRCARLGIATHHNHAFRVSYNSRLITLGFSASERALILGHAVETNERHYSVTDSRKLDELWKKLQ